MSGDQILVFLGGLVTTAFVIWYFFLYKKQATSAEMGQDVQEISIHVKGGYSPDVVILKKNLPAKLKFYREEESSCSEEVVFPDFRIRETLPAFQTKEIAFTPEVEGEFEFHCGMNMLRGKLIVQ